MIDPVKLKQQRSLIGSVTVRCQDCFAEGQATPTGHKNWSVAWPNITQRWHKLPLPVRCPECYDAFRRNVAGLPEKAAR